MFEAETGDAVRLLNLLLAFFADEARWTRGRYHDGDGGRCLVGAVDHLRRKHRIASDGAVSFLAEAMPRRGTALVYFNDHHCGSVAELRRVIVKARALALGEAQRRREAAAVGRWLLAELARERAAPTAAGGGHPTSSPDPDAPDAARIAA
jgi:hypothetical protein